MGLDAALRHGGEQRGSDRGAQPTASGIATAAPIACGISSSPVSSASSPRIICQYKGISTSMPNGASAISRLVTTAVAMHRALEIRVAAVIPALLDEVEMDGAEMRAASDPGVTLVQDLIDTAKREGALRQDVTFGDIGTLVVRLSRPLPGSFPRAVNDQLGHRHPDLLINGLRAVPGHAELGGPGTTFADLREMPPHKKS